MPDEEEVFAVWEIHDRDDPSSPHMYCVETRECLYHPDWCPFVDRMNAESADDETH